MGKMPILALRAVIAVLVAISLFVQIVMVAANANEMDPALVSMGNPWALIGAIVFGLLVFEVVLVCVWQLLAMVRRGTVFSYASFRYVDVIIGAIVAEAVLLAVLLLAQVPGSDGESPGVFIMMGGIVLAVLFVALIVLVLRMLLAQAVAREVEAKQMRADLDEVI
ncbi:DUF2975 domain-containing protein [Catellatospora coxensis]|uniref:Transporter n=2 Tax=Catellatospora coxensis TaxID=310354 RepID=A0A8J3P9L7_9ACTN|nr:transporter [Catellatospora coxensis]